MIFSKLVFRVHAIQRMHERSISEDEVRHVLMTGETIEAYSSDIPVSEPVDARVAWVTAHPRSRSRCTNTLTVCVSARNALGKSGTRFEQT